MFDTVGLGELCRKAAGVDVTLAADSELLAAALGLDRARSLADAAAAHVLAELEARGVCDRDFGHTTATWLSNSTNTARNTCRARVRDARRLVLWFDEFDTALSEGLLTQDHVGLLCRVANIRNREALADAQAQLIVLAAEFSFEQWAMLVRQLAAELDADGGYDPNDDIHANRLRLAANGDHTIEVGGRLVGEARTTVAHTLGTIADELFARYKADRKHDPDIEMPTRATLMALALAEACRRAGAVEIASTQAPRTEAIIIIEETAESGPVLRTPDAERLPDAAAHLLSDPIIRALVTDTDRIPLRYGRARRYATTAQRTAIAARDGGCIFPGCEMPPGWCDIHHQPAWESGGHTDTETMAMLCRHHHGVTHRNGWHMKPHPAEAQRWQWETPTGRTIDSVRRSDRHRTGRRTT